MYRSLLVAALLAATGMSSAYAVDARPDASMPTSARPYGEWGFDTRGMDRDARPGDGFARYAFGDWLDASTIPADQPGVGVRFEMEKRNDARIREVIEAAARNPRTHEQRLIGALYHAYLDEARLEALGLSPLDADLQAIRSATDKTQLARLMGQGHAGFGMSLFEASVGPNLRDTSKYSLRLQQSGLGAQNKDPYGSEQMKAAYAAYVAQMLELAGWAAPTQRAADVVDFEARVAAESWSNADAIDVAKIFNPMTVQELAAFAPGYPWMAFLDGAGLADVRTVVAMQKSAFPGIAKVFADTDLETLKAWQAFHKVDRASPYLSKSLQDARSGFWGRMQGMQPPTSREQAAVAVVNSSLVHPVARDYMARHFQPEARAQVEAMVGHIRASLLDRIEAVEWMGAQTKGEAVRKLKAVRVAIGYPHQWRDYSTLELRADDLYGDMAKIRRFDWDWTRAKLQRPVDRDEWLMAPQAVGAVASHPRLLITFSAGALQPPYFDPDADAAVNYGGIGGVIGHELGHFFDNQGWRIDSRGELRSWWSPEDEATFHEKTQRLIRQLEAHEASPGVRVNGRETLSETLANLLGFEVALDAYHASLQGAPSPVIDGFTGDQRYFLSFAQAWKANTRADWWASLVEQAPPTVTVDTVSRNIDEWYTAFGVQPGDKLYLTPEDRVRIW